MSYDATRDHAWIIGAIRDIADKADRADAAEEALDAVARDRDRWRALAEELGVEGKITADTARHHLTLTVLLDAGLLAMTKGTDSLVTAVLSKMHRDLTREIERKRR